MSELVEFLVDFLVIGLWVLLPAISVFLVWKGMKLAETVRVLVNQNVFGFRMTGIMGKGDSWFIGYSRRIDD